MKTDISYQIMCPNNTVIIKEAKHTHFITLIFVKLIPIFIHWTQINTDYSNSSEQNWLRSQTKTKLTNAQFSKN